MLRTIALVSLLAAAACVPGYTRAEVVYAEPADYVYVVPPERVVVVTREGLVSRGWVVYRVERGGPNRVIWARRGDDDIVRILGSPQGAKVAVRGLRDACDRGRHRGCAARGPPRD